MTRTRLGLCNLEGGRGAKRGKVGAFQASTGFKGSKERCCRETENPVSPAICIWNLLPLRCYQTSSLQEEILARRRAWDSARPTLHFLWRN